MTQLSSEVRNVITRLGHEHHIGSRVGKLVIDPASTLNTYYNILPTLIPETSTLKYFGIGVRGAYNYTGLELNGVNIPSMLPYTPRQQNMNLYTPIPFRIVPQSADLVDRSQYRMRVPMTIVVDGVSELYWAYYLKLIDFADNTVNTIMVDIATSAQSDMVYSEADFTPTPTTEAESITQQIITSISGSCVVTGEEIQDAVTYLFGGNSAGARISEFGFFGGSDHVIDTSRTEVIGAQLLAHRCTSGDDLSSVNAVCTQDITIANGDTYVVSNNT